jgi:starvation-inducible DNA-binding protein
MSETIDLLKVAHATNFMLYNKTHVAHWNVTGSSFPQLHKLFEKQYDELWEQVDEYAEKLRRLQVFTPVSLVELVSLSIIEDYTEILNANDYVEALLIDHLKIIELLKSLFHTAEHQDYIGLSNYVQDRIDAHEKTAWMLRSTLVPSI